MADKKRVKRLCRAAESTEVCLRRAVRLVDAEFVSGFAWEHPEVLAAVVNCLVVNEALERLSEFKFIEKTKKDTHQVV
jgi:hypothetical protein